MSNVINCFKCNKEIIIMPDNELNDCFDKAGIVVDGRAYCFVCGRKIKKIKRLIEKYMKRFC